MKLNWIVILGTGLIPILVGFFWYGKLFGEAWMRESGMTKEKAEGMNMPLVMGLAVLLGIFATFALVPAVIHQMGVYSTLQEVVGWESIFKDFVSKYGDNFRTFKHGAFHGIITSICLGLPLIAMNALWERRSFKYVAIHVGYWAVCLAIMGGIICQWGGTYN
jgi:hypothetical protein